MTDGAHDHPAIGARIDAVAGSLELEADARQAADNGVMDQVNALAGQVAALTARVTVLETPVVPPVVTPPPVVPPGAIVLGLTDAIVVKPGQTYVLRGGVRKFAWGPTDRHEANVTFMPYPGELVTFDGTGLALQNFLYLGTGAVWTFRPGIALRNFAPKDSGWVAYGDGADLTWEAPDLLGVGPMDPNVHLIYGHGATGTGKCTLKVVNGVGGLLNAQGAALHHYRGHPNLTAIGIRVGGQYISVLCYAGTMDLQGVTVVGPAKTDIKIGQDAQSGPGFVKVDAACRGTGPNGSLVQAA